MNTNVNNRFLEGLKDGIPIGVGYLSVSMSFGMIAVSMGIPLEIAVLISLTNLTSAGQFAGLNILLMQNAYFQMALTQLIINMRYFLMSLSLSQKVDKKMTTLDRMLIAFGITDEIFALASNKEGKVGRNYMLGLMLLPIAGWTLGTFIGAGASTLLPESISNCLQIAIYGMFLAIIIPPAKKDKNVRTTVIMAALLSCAFALLSSVVEIGSGFVIIICTILSAGCMAILHPIKEEEYE